MDDARSGIAYVTDSHAILSACRDLIASAERCIVLQMYLFAANGHQTLLKARPGAFPYADTVADWLIEKRRARPDVTIVVLLDSNTPANPALTRRGGTLVRERLAREGVIVLTACLFGTTFDRRKRLYPPMNFHLDHGGVALSDWVEHQCRWQSLHNVEDHRKNLVIDGGRAGAVTSHNFIDPAFDWHENLFWLTGDVACALHRTAVEAVAQALTIPQAIDAQEGALLLRRLREVEPPSPERLVPTNVLVEGYGAPWKDASSLARDDPAALLESEAIKPSLVRMLDEAVSGDEVLIATTYISDTSMLEVLERAAARGVRVRMLIDSLDGLPLPAVPSWLSRTLVNHAGIEQGREAERRTGGAFSLRVHDSRDGSMMHLKTAARLGASPMLIGGQANYTPNSFSGAWLETNVVSRSRTIVDAFSAHFDALWSLDASRAPRALGPLRRGAYRAVIYGLGRIGLRA